MKSYSIEDLSGLTGFDRRAIRSFIEQGLMRGPDKMGRYAQYSTSHLNRLLAIKFFREKEGMNTGSIRSKMLTMSPSELDTVAKNVLADKDTNNRSSALDYLKSIGLEEDSSQSNQNSIANDRIQSDLTEKNQYKSAFDLLADDLANLLGNRTVRKQAKSQNWHRISITPDIEISVRGIEDEEQIKSLERISDHLREILMGGTR